MQPNTFFHKEEVEKSKLPMLLSSLAFFPQHILSHFQSSSRSIYSFFPVNTSIWASFPSLVTLAILFTHKKEGKFHFSCQFTSNSPAQHLMLRSKRLFCRRREFHILWLHMVFSYISKSLIDFHTLVLRMYNFTSFLIWLKVPMSHALPQFISCPGQFLRFYINSQ